MACSRRGLLLASRGALSVAGALGKPFGARAAHLAADPGSVMKYKRLFGALIGGGSLLGAFWVNKRKGDRLKALLQECTRVPVKEGIFDPKTHLYRYGGYVLPGQIVLSGVLQQLPDFQFRNTDVLVASYPKTGTTWVQEIVYMLTHGCRPSQADDPTLETRFPYLEYPYPGLRSVARDPGPRCIKTHLPHSLLPPSLHTAGTKVVYVTRNPRDTAISYYHFVRLLTSSGFIGTFQDFIDLFLNDIAPYSPFHAHVRSYWAERSTDAVLCVTYEELSADPTDVVRRIAQHLNVAVSDEDVQFVVTRTTFDAMADNPSVNYQHWKDIGFARTDVGNFLRKGKVGGWLHSLTDEQVAQFADWEQREGRTEDPLFTYKLETSNPDL